MGEPKTVVGKGIIKKGNFTTLRLGADVFTPRIESGIAYFNLTNDYSFDFNALSWRYLVHIGYLDFDKFVRQGWITQLKSPDKSIIITLRKIDIPSTVKLSYIEGLATPIEKLPQKKMELKTIEWIMRNELKLSKLEGQKIHGLKNVIIRDREYYELVAEILDDEGKEYRCHIYAKALWDYIPNEHRYIVWTATVIDDGKKNGNRNIYMDQILQTLEFNARPSGYSKKYLEP